MKKFSIFIALFLMNFSFSQSESKIDGIIIPQKVIFSDSELFLNGVGTRSKLWADIYTQALYLSFTSNNAKDVINSNTKMAMIFHITSPLVTSQRFSKNLNNSIKRTLSEKQWKAFKQELDVLDSFINSDKIVKNDIFNLVYNDVDSSIWVIKNGVVKGKIPGFEFKKAFFGIWLSEKPVNDHLKNDLLGL